MPKSLYRVTEEAGEYVNGQWVRPGDLLTLSEPEARYERDQGFIVETTAEAEARPLDLSDAERAALPVLGDEPGVDMSPIAAPEDGAPAFLEAE